VSAAAATGAAADVEALLRSMCSLRRAGPGVSAKQCCCDVSIHSSASYLSQIYQTNQYNAFRHISYGMGSRCALMGMTLSGKLEAHLDSPSLSPMALENAFKY
jgi:hypothetical protein